jgi:hypothetical protein
MTGSNEQLRTLILTMLAPARQVEDSAFAGITDADWSDFSRICRQHRLGPLLHHRDQKLGQKWPVPLEIREIWRDEHRRAALNALKLERALHGVAETLAKEDIEFIALKGAWLAWNAYPHPALRPMRDLDILVAHEHALRTRKALLANGYTEIARYTEPPEAALDRRKHLPGIRSTESGVVIEIHTRLVDLSGSEEKDAAADADREKQLQHKVTANLRGNPIFYLAPTDTLLHLIVHSVYDHRMNNGPAIFDDIAQLVQTHPVDWTRFWSRAHAQGWTSGCQLLLLLASRQYGALAIVWPDGKPPEIPEKILSSAMLLSLQDHKQRMVVSLMGKATTSMDSGAGAKGVLARLYAPRHQMAPLIGLKADNPLAFLGYPIWLYNAAARATQGLFRRSARDDTAKYAALSRWLGVTGQHHHEH